MILHLLFGDKFGEYAVRQFSDPEMSSVLIFVTQKWDKYQPASVEGARVIGSSSKEFKEVLACLGDYKAVILHGLFQPWQARVLQSVPDGVKVAWVFWGGEIYGRNDLRDRFLAPRTKCFLAFREIVQRVKRKTNKVPFQIPFELLKRIDYCLTDIPEDFAFVKGYFGTEIKELWYNYYSVEETLGDLATETVDGSNILIGNSCSIECNHLDCFSLIHQFSLKDSKVIVPLNYGEDWLKSKLLKTGKRLFGDRFVPLTDFMPRDAYNRILKSCSVAIMPHYRPQAFGNILTALWLGSRVYLSRKNHLFAFFKRIGVVLYSLEEDLSPRNPASLTPLSDEQRNQNRKVIASIYGKEIMRQKNLEIVKVLNS